MIRWDRFCSAWHCTELLHEFGFGPYANKRFQFGTIYHNVTDCRVIWREFAQKHNVPNPFEDADVKALLRVVERYLGTVPLNRVQAFDASAVKRVVRQVRDRSTCTFDRGLM